MQVVSESFVSDVYRQFGGAVSLGCGGCGRGRLLGLKYNARSNFLVLLISGDLLTATAHGSVRVLLRSESTLNDDPNRGVVSREWKMFLTSGFWGKVHHRDLILLELSTGGMNFVVEPGFAQCGPASVFPPMK
ncbi:hypothetical protein Bca4012_049412 [Brassica carinata]